jgi:hypothetical protein
MNWTRMPDASGWWFFTRDLSEWDLCGAPIAVEQHDSGDRATFHRRIPYGSPKIESYEGWWFGPFRVEKPYATANDLDRLKAAGIQ